MASCQKGKGCYQDICEKTSVNSNEKTKTDIKYEGGICADLKFQLKNPYISKDKEDILYHLALGNKSHNLVEMFGDVKFVCMGGTPTRMERFAYYMLNEIGYYIPPGTKLQDLSDHSHRYAMFKVGPILSVSHGMGIPSVTILLHELLKLLYHAGVKDPIFLRIGTCGGLGVEPGTVVVTNEALDGLLRPTYAASILGKYVERPTVLSQTLVADLLAMSDAEDDFKVVSGKTVATNDFYEGQGRLDGAFCSYTEKERSDFLEKARAAGVVNMEMEATALAAITNYVGVKCGIVCVTLLDRLKGDQVNQPKEKMTEWQDRPMLIIGRYITKYLDKNPDVWQRSVKQDMVKPLVCPSCVSVQVSLDSSGSETSSVSSSPKNSIGSSPKGSQDENLDENIQDLKCLPGCNFIVFGYDALERVMNESFSYM